MHRHNFSLLIMKIAVLNYFHPIYNKLTNIQHVLGLDK